jgi:hypothetical protein
VLTADGEIELSRRYFWSKGQAGTYPVDQSAGIDQGRVSPGAREILCRLGMVQDFDQGAEDARRIGNVPVCKERLRQIVEGEGQAIREARESGILRASWSAEDARIGPDLPRRIYEGSDGVMAPTVTAAEKKKRRRSQAIRRQQRSAAGVGNAQELPAPRPGSDERFKEMKIGIFYDQEKKHRHVFATEQECDRYGPLLKQFAAQIGFERAEETISLVDGAKWIVTQVCSALLCLKALMLDFYHLSQHVHAAAVCCLGETEAAKTWAMERLKEFKEIGVQPVLAAIDTLMKQVRAQPKRKSLESLRQYIVQRLEMLDYRGALARGWDIGSGPTEAMCKNLTLRLKRPGMKWDRDHAAAMMSLHAMYESGQAKAYWSGLKAAA